MPQSGPRGSPWTLLWKDETPAWAKAAARIVPGGTLTVLPLTEIVTQLRIAGVWLWNQAAGALERKAQPVFRAAA